MLGAFLPAQLSAGTLLPLPSASDAAAESTVLYLEVEVNGQAPGTLLEVLQRGSHFEIEAQALRQMHVQNGQPAGTRVAVDALPGVTVDYDSLGQRLRLSVPTQWLPMQRLADETPEERPTSAAGSGMLLNYDLYTSHSRAQSITSLWSEQRHFSPRGVISNTGIVRLQSTGGDRGYIRHDTRWTSADTAQATETTYGDLVSDSLPWTTSVRMAGVQWARNFGVRPDLITYPLPEFAGQAALPSAVDLFVNGFKAASHRVAAGPFTLGELPVVSGAGTASVVTTDALGRQVYTTIPFYVNRELLRPGWTDYSLSLGALRRAYGLRSFAYGRPIAAGVYRQGLSDRFTIEAQAQLGKGLGVAGVGGMAGLGMLGIANASLTRGYTARAGSGWQYTVGWQYHTPRAGFSFQQTGRDARFGDASTYADDGYQLSQRSRQLSASWNLGTGSITGGWLDLRNARNERNRLVFASYNVPVAANTFLSLTAGRTVDTRENQLRLQLTYFLGDRSTAQLAASKSRESTQTYASYQRTMPTEGGYGWSVAQTLSGGPQRYSQAALQYRNSTLSAEAGVSATPGQTTQWGTLSGSLGSIDGHLFAANRVYDGFALVSTQGMPGVPILYENQLAGHTNAQGYLLVPSVPAYYPGRYAVDPLTLPADVDIPALERRMSVSRNAGMLVELPVLRLRTATITLVDAQGTPMKAGSAVLHTPGNMQTVVGWDGVVYLTVLRPQNSLQVRTPEGDTCRAEFSEAAYASARDLIVRCLPAAPRTQEGPAR